MAFRLIVGFSVIWIVLGTVSAQKKSNIEYWVIGNQTGIEIIYENQLNNIFHGQVEYWGNDLIAEVVLHKSNSVEGLKTAELFYNGSIKNMQRFWLTVVFSGRARSPKYLENHETIVDYVQATPGAIAIVFKQEGIEKLYIPLAKGKHGS